MRAANSENDFDLRRLAEFINEQPHLPPTDLAALKAAGRTSDVGITSLGAIGLVVAYLKRRGLDDASLDPDWLPDLEFLDGLLRVFKEIDRRTEATRV